MHTKLTQTHTLTVSVTCQDHDCGLADKEKSELVKSRKMLNVPLGTEIDRETLSLKVEMVGLVFQFGLHFLLIIFFYEFIFSFCFGSSFFLMI